MRYENLRSIFIKRKSFGCISKFASNCFLQALLYKDLTQKKQHVLRCDLIKKMICKIK